MQSTLNDALKNSALYSWWWVDTFFMALGTWYHYGKILNNNLYWDFAYSQYNSTAYGGPNGLTTQPGLWDQDIGLFYRDYTYIPKTTPSGKPIIWARGNGWAMSACVESLKMLPSDHPYATEYKEKLVIMANSLKQLQGSDGFWRASLLDYSEFPNPETTGTASFVYGIAYGLNNGLLSIDDFGSVVLTAWEGLTTISLKSNGLIGYCQGAGSEPAAAGENETYDYCVGQFLLAGSEMFKFVSTNYNNY